MGVQLVKGGQEMGGGCSSSKVRDGGAARQRGPGAKP